ncbi:orotidine 5'-phosphate decarboxylase [Dinochytrium kinnereticum]|nr:orotidine 5'-phosphate decarboxylase [Dinochytrium kinnereticum]
MSSVRSKTYSARAASHTNATAKRLLHLMDRKQTNLSLSADVTKKADLLKLADLLGPYICVLKTHIDIVEDFDHDLVDKLTVIAAKHDFLIFEDRKFADIGNTVKLQYSSGVHKIASWSHITNAHPIPGDGIVQGLSEVGLPLGRSLLLLAEMSSKGSLARGDYTLEAFRMAQRHRAFCIGFIGQQRLEDSDPTKFAAAEGEDFVYMTPGVGLDVKGDSLGQVYRTPRQVILESGCDVIIVGRGIYGSLGNGGGDLDVVEVAKSYKKAGWEAYLERIGQKNGSA